MQLPIVGMTLIGSNWPTAASTVISSNPKNTLHEPTGILCLRLFGKTFAYIGGMAIVALVAIVAIWAIMYVLH